MLSYPEGRAALAAARRAKRLTESAYARALADFEELQHELAVVQVDRSLARQAGELADDLGLRGYVAVHLASALTLSVNGVTVVSWDRDLTGAALASGCAVAPAP